MKIRRGNFWFGIRITNDETGIKFGVWLFPFKLHAIIKPLQIVSFWVGPISFEIWNNWNNFKWNWIVKDYD